jgi:8-oxo-dGTP pyrophosphatase MutT (NUDIX family)
MTGAPVHPASTVVLLRPSPARFDVFLLRRHDRVAFMGGAHVFPGGRVDAADAHASEEVRHRLAAVRELREEAAVDLEIGALIPFARWITPDIEIRRFDTWFFVAALPPGQAARHDGVESSDAMWVDPAAAVELCRRRAIALPPPTWTTLRALAALQTVDDVLRWARERTLLPVQPHVLERGGRMLLVLPGDPEYPGEGTAVATETRFVLEEGRWRALSGGGDR